MSRNSGANGSGVAMGAPTDVNSAVSNGKTTLVQQHLQLQQQELSGGISDNSRGPFEAGNAINGMIQHSVGLLNPGACSLSMGDCAQHNNSNSHMGTVTTRNLSAATLLTALSSLVSSSCNSNNTKHFGYAPQGETTALASLPTQQQALRAMGELIPQLLQQQQLQMFARLRQLPSSSLGLINQQLLAFLLLEE
ncbi:hypothetical protein IV203_017036 [Nitzschia inconspicua]|uniref:Uncharacterized protein n=1 Tax=Nitzschia inconspicua TaxID=303405 RepID=A0A9K3KRR8_9STRA|nr:hypothetical protein IV203_017036 [Nitzschia inconspicua]